MRHYKHLAKYNGVCGGRTVVKGTRIEPRHIIGYGSIDDTVNHFGLTRDQVIECYHYHINSQPEADEVKKSLDKDWQAVGNAFRSILD